MQVSLRGGAWASPVGGSGCPPALPGAWRPHSGAGCLIVASGTALRPAGHSRAAAASGRPCGGPPRPPQRHRARGGDRPRQGARRCRNGGPGEAPPTSARRRCEPSTLTPAACPADRLPACCCPQVERVAKVGGLYKNFTSGQALSYLDGTLPGGAWPTLGSGVHSRRFQSSSRLAGGACRSRRAAARTAAEAAATGVPFRLSQRSAHPEQLRHSIGPAGCSSCTLQQG